MMMTDPCHQYVRISPHIIRTLRFAGGAVDWWVRKKERKEEEFKLPKRGGNNRGMLDGILENRVIDRGRNWAMLRRDERRTS